MSGADIKAFNDVINPSNNAIYIALSRTASGKGTPIILGDAMTILATDSMAEMGVFLPQDIACIEIVDDAIIKYIVDEKLNLPIFKFDETYYIYAKESGIKTTTCNTLVCGVTAQTYGYSKSARALPLPFKPSTSKSTKLETAEVVWLPKKIQPLPVLLKPLYKLSKPVAESDLQYPLSVDVGNSLIDIYRNLTKIGYGQSGRRQLIKEINDKLTGNPMTDDELENLMVNSLLQSEVSQFFGPKEQFMHNKMGDFLIDNNHIKRDKKSKQLYFWDDKDKIYKSDTDMISGTMTRLCPTIKEHQRQEVMHYLDSILCFNGVEFNSDPTKIVFQNGILDIETMKLSPMTPDNFETIQLNCEYNPEAKGETADTFFNTATCGDKIIETLLYEAIGYSMLKTNDLHKSFLLIGGGRNGKSTYFELIKSVLGRDNTTTISFQDLATTFRASSLDNKLASLAGDISNQPVQESDMFKSITAGEDVMIEKKFQDAYERVLFSTMFFSANNLPRTTDTSEGFYRRFCIIPFNASLKKISEVDGMLFKRKLLSKENIEYVAYKAVCAINRVLTTSYEFTRPKQVDDMLQEYKIFNSSVLSWFEDAMHNDPTKINRYSTSSMYSQYKTWCGENTFGACRSSNFIKQICQQCDMTVDELGRFKFKEEKNLLDLAEDVDTDELPFDDDIADNIDALLDKTEE